MKQRMRLLRYLLLLQIGMILAGGIHAQTKTVSGVVLDSIGKPLEGASVQIKGKSTGVVTDANGHFSISAKPGDVLTITTMNYLAREVKVNNNNSYTVRLSTSQDNALNEVIVTTALGVKRQAKELGYSTATINASKLNQAAVVNAATGMAAKVPGVDIRLADNGVNPQVKVTFRGSRSIEGDNSALIVVDGVPVDGSYLTNLNPSDIENVSILKGANAAALYGMAASNGIMNISTKRGRGKFNLTYENVASFESISYYPKLQGEYGMFGGEYSDPFSGQPQFVPYENQGFGPAYNALDPQLRPDILFGHGDSVPIGINANQQLVYGPYKYYPNGRKDFFQTAFGDQNKLSGSFGGKWGGVYVSGEHTSKQGVVPKDKYNRNGFRVNGNFNLGRLTINAGVSYNNVSTNIAGNSYNQYRPVYWDVINSASFIDLKSMKDINQFQNNQGYIGAFYPNPWWSVYNSRAKTSTNQLLSSLQLNYKLTDWLSITSRSGYSRTSEDAPGYIDSISFPSWLVQYAKANPLYFYSARTNNNSPYQYEDVKTHYEDFNEDLFATLTKTVNKFKFNLVVGGNYRARNSYGYWFSNQQFSANTVGQNIIPTLYTKVTNPDGSASATFNYKRFDQALYSDLTIGYDAWLFLHASFRNDWTSILAPGYRSFNYPSVDLSAVLSDKLDAIKNSPVVSFLKLRLGYAQTGNVSLSGITPLGVMGNIGSNGGVNGYSAAIPNFGAYGIYPVTPVGSGFPFGNGNSFSQGYTVVQGGNNPTLRPERTKSFETGFQLGLFKNRINLEANYYNQISENQTIPLQTSQATGVSTFLTNAGKMKNQGVELDLNLTPLLKLGDFKFDLDANFAYLNTKVVELQGNAVNLSTIQYGTVTMGGIFAEVGKPFPEIKVTDFNRDVNGKIIVDGTTGLPIGTNPNLVDAGNASYKYFFGLSPTFSYKNISLSAVFDYRGGAKILNEEGAAMDFAGISTNSAVNRQAFVIPNSVIGGDATHAGSPNTSVPISSPTGNGPAAYYYYTNAVGQLGMPYVVSADFLKLREVSLTYTVPNKWLRSQNIVKGLKLAVIGRNLFMWRPKTNIWSDPEFSTNAQGNAVGYTTEYQTPPTRIISVALTANLF